MVGFGGYVATPAYIAARRLRVPIVVHEQNARPGLANRLGARFAAAVGVTFAGTRLRNATLTGLPLRPAIADLVSAREADRWAARAAGASALGLDPGRPVLLVTGGSLGAAQINRAVAGAAAELLAAGAQVLHLTGAGKDDEVRRAVHEATGGAPTRTTGCSPISSRCSTGWRAPIWSSAARAPARSASSPLSASRRSTCRYPIGNGEQRLNAAGVVEAGGGILVDDAHLTAAWVREHVVPLLADGARLAEMGSRAAEVGVRDGAARLADLVEEASRGGGS